ncbi:MAG: hypothetical protein JSU96_01660 [Acidobacteriota bacterium]|nr:MAG: hypothetical protein JSU96_01660 [Acidobacteriota bacterium]
MRKIFLYGLTTILVLGVALGADGAQWNIPSRDREILIDGFTSEWAGVPTFQITPERKDLRSGGTFKEGDVALSIQALWDEQYLYLALRWSDDVWDIKEVGRKDAVWVDSEGKRRDRMYFYDNLKFHIRASDYDYTLWLSPRVNEEGPFVWARLLEGYKGMERATATPMVSSREQNDGSVTMEVMLLWKELRLKPGDDFSMPLTLVLSDGDHPGRMLDYKVEFLKWLGWVGKLTTPE